MESKQEELRVRTKKFALRIIRSSRAFRVALKLRCWSSSYSVQGHPLEQITVRQGAPGQEQSFRRRSE
jgi:hypothetical protein